MMLKFFSRRSDNSSRSPYSCYPRDYSALSYSAALIFFLNSAPLAVAETINVHGWTLPLTSGNQPEATVGDDPVFGRLACPPLTRLNLDKRRSEPLLIKKVTEELIDAQKRSLWRFDLRPDIFWWNGDALSAEDLAIFLRQQIGAIVNARAGGLWPIPEHLVRVDAKDSVSILWQQKPSFGAYILNGFPLWRAATAGGSPAALKFECTGLYTAELAASGLSLKPAKGYKGLRPELQLHPAATSAVKKATKPEKLGKNVIEFQNASFFGGSPWARLSDEEAVCNLRLDLPFITLLTWNTQSGPTANSAFRKAMTELTPRGALLRSGAANLGELLSAPIPRQHPGYNAQVLLRPFAMEHVSSELDRLGYHRKRADAPRLSADGQALKIYVATAAGSMGLVEKVLADAFTAVGIGIEFVLPTAHSTQLNAVLTGVKLEWPRSDLLLNFHSHFKDSPDQSFPFWPLADKELDRELEAYALSLTTATPDFSRLSQVHAKLFELEPVTVLMQHEACVEAGGDFGMKLKNVNSRDPDWFRKLIL